MLLHLHIFSCDCDEAMINKVQQKPNISLNENFTYVIGFIQKIDKNVNNIRSKHIGSSCLPIILVLCRPSRNYVYVNEVCYEVY